MSSSARDGDGFSRLRPISAAASNASSCTPMPGNSHRISAVARASPRVKRSRQNLPPRFSTASATTTTASHFRPLTRPFSQASGSRVAYRATITMIRKDGRVKPRNAATPPASPPRCRQMAKPSWLDDGPGRNCVRASRRA